METLVCGLTFSVIYHATKKNVGRETKNLYKKGMLFKVLEIN